MACNGMAPSFFPPNFLLQMQTAQHGDDDHQQYQQHSAAIPPPPASYEAAHLFQAAPPVAINPHDYQALAVAALPVGKKSVVVSLSGPFDPSGCGGDNNAEDELSDDCSQLVGAGEKKRRLNVDQVRTLERSFELANKLEPERKMQLARTLGLQPRQIAIWFQNRRARWKTKKLERDYDVLKKQFDDVKSENDALQAHNKKLQAEIIALRGRDAHAHSHAPPPEPINLNKETDGSSSNRTDNSSAGADVQFDLSRPLPAIDSPPPNPNRASTRTASFFASLQPPPSHRQLLHTPMSCRPEPPLCAPKIEPQTTTQATHDESFSSMFCSIDDQTAFWATWPDHQGFH